MSVEDDNVQEAKAAAKLAAEQAKQSGRQGRAAAKTAARAARSASAPAAERISEVASDAADKIESLAENAQHVNPSVLTRISSETGQGVVALFVALWAGSIAFGHFRVAFDGKNHVMQTVPKVGEPR